MEDKVKGASSLPNDEEIEMAFEDLEKEQEASFADLVARNKEIESGKSKMDFARTIAPVAGELEAMRDKFKKRRHDGTGPTSRKDMDFRTTAEISKKDLTIDILKREFMKHWRQLLKTNDVIIYDKEGFSNKKVLHNMALYFMNDTSSEYPLDKGLYVCGLYGSGKTEMMKAWNKALYHCRNDYRSYTKDNYFMKDYIAIRQEVSDINYFKTWSRSSLFIDDLGREEDSPEHVYVNNYGTKVKVAEILIKQRYEKCHKKGVQTYFTSNKDIEDICEFYGPGPKSWLKGMVTEVLWYGDDLRT